MSGAMPSLEARGGSRGTRADLGVRPTNQVRGKP
jgi:hypothetical protein